MEELTCAATNMCANLPALYAAYSVCCHDDRDKPDMDKVTSPLYVTPYLEDIHVKETFILATERTCLLIASVLVLISFMILIVGTFIVSCCSREDEIDYTKLPQGEWLPEHLDFDSIMDLLHNIHKKEQMEALDEFLARGKHRAHLGSS